MSANRADCGASLRHDRVLMGATHFQMKTLKHVSTAMAVHLLAYNMKRVMRILGVAGLMEAIRA
jgi:hypothetical protein